MIIQNLNFFDKNGESYNFAWDSNRNVWYGNEWLPPVSVALFDNSNVFILEKRMNGSYGFPMLNPGESILLKWENSEHESEFFLYNIAIDSASQQFYIQKIESQTFSYSDYPTFNPTNSPDIAASKLTVGASSCLLTWRAIPNLPYSYSIVTGSDPATGTVIASGNIPLGDYSLDITSVATLTLGQVYTVVLTVTHFNSTVNGVDLTFTAGLSQVVYGVNDLRYTTQPTELDGESVLQFNVAFNPIEEKGYTRILKGYYLTNNGITSTQFLEMTFYGEGETEDERFNVWLQNFGIKFNREDALILKDYDLTEALPDWSVINEKRKELLVSKDQIFPYVGTYKGLTNLIDIMGYKQTVRVKEYWQNQNERSEYYNKYAMIDITDLLDTGRIGSMNLVGLNSQIKHNKQFHKTNMLALVYEFDIPTGEYDADGIPILKRSTEFTVNQIFYKLNGLGKKIKAEFLPINVIIKDIIGEFLYFDKLTFRLWYDRVDIRDIEINTAYDIVVKTPEALNTDLEILDIKSLYKQGVSGYPVISFNTSATDPFQNGQRYPLSDIENWKNAIEDFYEHRLNLTFAALGTKPEWEYSDENTALIGCPIILDTINDAPIIRQLDGVTIEETGKNRLTVGGIQYLNFYEIQWTITGLTTTLPYTFQWRGPIAQLAQLPHILPYLGEYQIKCQMYDLYGGVSVRYTKVTVVPQTPIILGIMKLEDKFNYQISNLGNVQVKDFEGSYVYVPKTIIIDNEHADDTMKAVDIDRMFLDWGTYSLRYGLGRSQYDVQVLSDSGVWEDYYVSVNPEKRYWGTAQNQPVATINDYQEAEIGDLFHTRLSDYGWQSDFQNGFYIPQASIVGGVSILTIGRYEPFTIPTFSDFENLVQQLNESDAPGILDFSWSVVGDKIHANARINSKYMHQIWDIQ